MQKSNLTIIIVTFNSERYINKCIESVVNSDNKNFEISKIIVIDNCSSDLTVIKILKLQKRFKIISLLKNKVNAGFACAVNQGIKESNGEYVLLLNPDTILRRNSLFHLVDSAKKNNAGICGGATIDNEGRVSGSHFRFPNLMVGIFDFTNFRKLRRDDKWHKYFYYQDRKQNSSFTVDVITGGYMLVKRSLFNKVGLFDESFFMYLEDVDFCLRAKNAGYKIYYSSKSEILHVGGASSKNKDRIRHSSWLWSRKKYFLKHFGVVKNILIQTIFLIDDLIIITKKSIGT